MREVISIIEKERKKRGWSAYRLEKASGLSLGTLRSWKKGVSPKLESIVQVLNVLEISYTIGYQLNKKGGKK